MFVRVTVWQIYPSQHSWNNHCKKPFTLSFVSVNLVLHLRREMQMRSLWRSSPPTLSITWRPRSKTKRIFHLINYVLFSRGWAYTDRLQRPERRIPFLTLLDPPRLFLTARNRVLRFNPEKTTLDHPLRFGWRFYIRKRLVIDRNLFWTIPDPPLAFPTAQIRISWFLSIIGKFRHLRFPPTDIVALENVRYSLCSYFKQITAPRLRL